MNEERILLGHGSGGSLMRDLINDLFVKEFGNSILNNLSDSAVLPTTSHNIVFTTDSYVVDPIFFPGGDIGKLAISGTVNDLAVCGAIPKYISCSFIIEEGFLYSDLKKIVTSISEEARFAGVEIVTGDTKVVNKGKCDKIFINTAGVGYVEEKFKNISTGEKIKSGDIIIINGNIAEHGLAVLMARNDFAYRTSIKSDCASLNILIREILSNGANVKFMRDATRGGLAAVLNEIAFEKNVGIEIDENKIPVTSEVIAICEMLGFDPLMVANEGKVVIVVDKDDETKVMEIMKNNVFGRNATTIGYITEEHKGKVFMNTQIGGKRIVDIPTGEQLPRIC